jgi:hypothetical protein
MCTPSTFVGADEVELQAAEPEDVSGHVEGQPVPRVQAEASMDPSVDSKVQSHIGKDGGGRFRRNAKGQMVLVHYRGKAQERLDPIGFRAAVGGGRRAWKDAQTGVKAGQGASSGVSRG